VYINPKTVETGQHPHINLLTYSEVESVEERLETSRLIFEEKQLRVGKAMAVASAAECPQESIRI